MGFAQSFERDTLTARTDSISVFNEENTYEYIYVTIKDTGTVVTDSFYVEKYDPYNAAWHQIGAKDLLTWTHTSVLLPGNNATQTWIIFGFGDYAEYIRVRKINHPSVDVTGTKAMITWQGVRSEVKKILLILLLFYSSLQAQVVMIIQRIGLQEESLRNNDTSITFNVTGDYSSKDLLFVLKAGKDVSYPSITTKREL